MRLTELPDKTLVTLTYDGDHKRVGRDDGATAGRRTVKRLANGTRTSAWNCPGS